MLTSISARQLLQFKQRRCIKTWFISLLATWSPRVRRVVRRFVGNMEFTIGRVGFNVPVGELLKITKGKVDV